MLKKDRIAIVSSVIYFFIVPVDAGMKDVGMGFLLCLPILLYWGYRFIQGDIDFKKNE